MCCTSTPGDWPISRGSVFLCRVPGCVVPLLLVTGLSLGDLCSGVGFQVGCTLPPVDRPTCKVTVLLCRAPGWTVSLLLHSYRRQIVPLLLHGEIYSYIMVRCSFNVPIRLERYSNFEVGLR